MAHATHAKNVTLTPAIRYRLAGVGVQVCGVLRVLGGGVWVGGVLGRFSLFVSSVSSLCAGVLLFVSYSSLEDGEAPPGRLELPTLRLTASRSNQLSYGSLCTAKI